MPQQPINTRPIRPTHLPWSIRRGFSLVEMLVVLLILTIVISIVIPTLQAARNSARKSATGSLMASLATAVGQFKQSQSRLPGYYSPRDMGAVSNLGNGFSAMENIMIDLAGGVTTDAASGSVANACDTTDNPVIAVGPGTAKVNIDVGRIGATEGGAKGEAVAGYFRPDPKFFARQCEANQRNPGGPTDARSAMPVLVDAWGQPILAWVQDELPSGTSFPLVANNSGTRARFYWTSNACFTTATSLGKLKSDQTDATTGSLLGAPGTSLAGLVGNPAFANEARGQMIFHSAGTNGVYLGRSERGGKASGGTLAAPVGRDYFQEGDFDDLVVKGE